MDLRHDVEERQRPGAVGAHDEPAFDGPIAGSAGLRGREIEQSMFCIGRDLGDVRLCSLDKCHVRGIQRPF